MGNNSSASASLCCSAGRESSFEKRAQEQPWAKIGHEVKAMNEQMVGAVKVRSRRREQTTHAAAQELSEENRRLFAESLVNSKVKEAVGDANPVSFLKNMHVLRKDSQITETRRENCLTPGQRNRKVPKSTFGVLYSIHKVEHEASDCIAVWLGSRVRKMSVDNSIAWPTFARTEGLRLMGFSIPFPTQREEFSSLCSFSFCGISLLAVSFTMSETDQSGIHIFFLKDATGSMVLPVRLHLLKTIETGHNPITQISFCPPNLLVGSTEAGRMIAWALSAAKPSNDDDDFIFPVKSDLSGRSLRAEQRVSHNLNGIIVGIFVEIVAQEKNSSVSIFEVPRPNSGGEEFGSFDILVVFASGLVEILRLGKDSTALETILAIDCSKDLCGLVGAIRITHSTVPRFRDMMSRYPQLSPTTQSTAHSFSLLFLSSESNETESVLSMWDLRKVGDPFVRIVTTVSSNPISSLCYGPFLNGPLVFTTIDGVAHVIDVNGEYLLHNEDLKGKDISSSISDFNDSVWCVASDGSYSSV